MRPVSQGILIMLLLAVCGLCVVQWWRESRLRETAAERGDALDRISAERNDLAARLKAADAEILRLTAALAELRGNSVSKETHEEAVKMAADVRETAQKQNAVLAEQGEALKKQNAAIATANETIRKLAAERDAVAARLNELTARYNKAVGSSQTKETGQP